MGQLKEWRSPVWRRLHQGIMLATGVLPVIYAVDEVVSSAPLWQKVVFCAALLPFWIRHVRWLLRLARSWRAAERVAAGAPRAPGGS